MSEDFLYRAAEKDISRKSLWHKGFRRFLMHFSLLPLDTTIVHSDGDSCTASAIPEFVCTGTPFTLDIMSPGFIPARSAGEPLLTETTITPSVRSFIPNGVPPGTSIFLSAWFSADKLQMRLPENCLIFSKRLSDIELM